MNNLVINETNVGDISAEIIASLINLHILPHDVSQETFDKWMGVVEKTLRYEMGKQRVRNETRITKAQLKKIIKEELENVMSESRSEYDSYVNRIRQTTDLTSVETDINKDKDLTPEQKEDLLRKVKDRRKSSTDSMPPPFYPVVF